MTDIFPDLKKRLPLSKKHTKKELKKMSRVFKPLEKILNEHYTKHIMSRHGDIMNVFSKKE